MTIRAEVLNTANDLVNGQRAEDYGPPADSFAIIAGLWSIVAATPLTPQQVALMLIQLKVARSMADPLGRDSYVDIAGYAACAAEVAEIRDTPEETAWRLQAGVL